MTTLAKMYAVKRDYKSRMFTLIFSDKEKLVELYNAVSRRNYDNPELLTINTLENAIYMSMKNDLSFLIYLADLYSAMVKGKNLYGTKRIAIPAPRFIVFYNGLEEQPDYKVLRLSESYMVEEEEVSLELKVDMLYINKGHNGKLMEACKTLRDYSEYVYQVRKYAKDMPIEDAVEKTINECIREGILREFLEQHRAEAKAMSIYEYNEEEHMRMERAESFEEGQKAERFNTERERRRADKAEERAQKAEVEVERLKKELAQLKNNK